MKSTLFCLLFLASWIHADDSRTFVFNADAWAEGDVPKEVFVVDGTIKIAAKDGNKVIMIDPAPIVDASAQLGGSSNGSSSIEARAFASKRGRSTPRFGVSLHGIKGYRLMLNIGKKAVELVKDDQVIQSAPYTWTSETWTRLKLEARKNNDADWTITGKAWPADAAEPKEPTVRHADNTMKGQGKCAIWGTPFSETPIYFDDIQISVTPAAPK